MTRSDSNRFGLGGISRKLYERVCQLVPYGSTVLELGAGDVSTVELSEKFKLYSVENNKDWIKNVSGVRYFHAPLVNGWYDPNIIETIPWDYSLILVDGPWGTGNRNGFAEHLNLFRHDVPIVFHDTDRTDERKLFYRTAWVLAARGVELWDDFGVIQP